MCSLFFCPDLKFVETAVRLDVPWEKGNRRLESPEIGHGCAFPKVSPLVSRKSLPYMSTPSVLLAGYRAKLF